MASFNLLKRLYSLDTLDTRFTISSKTPPSVEKDIKLQGRDVPGISVGSNSKAKPSDAQPSKWRTREFYFYYVVFILAVPMMFKVTYDVSKGEKVIYNNEGSRMLRSLQSHIPTTPDSPAFSLLAGSQDTKW